jgi:hypothetical protein
MSYKSEDKELVVKAVKALMPVVLSPKWRNDPALLMAVKKGWIFPGKIVEDQLIEKSDGLLKANTNHKRSEDFNDYSDAKFVSVTEWKYQYRVSLDWIGFKNKKGALRVVVYERMQNRLYYFYIPRRAYRDMRVIKIPFDLKTGDPKDTNKWWAYEVDSFKELAQIKKEDWINVR